MLAIEYGTTHTPAKLLLLADDWAMELAEENPQSVAAALDLHRRESARFPTLSQVLALLPRCRVIPAHLALPEAPPTEDWRAKAAMVKKALNGDKQARQYFDAVLNANMSTQR